MIQKNTDKPERAPDQANRTDSTESANDSMPEDEKAEKSIANMDAIDFQTLLEEQMNR